MVLLMVTFVFFFFLFLLFILRLILHYKSKALSSSWCIPSNCRTVGFFHPYCNSGGGGERVLWKAISALQDRYDDIICIVYTGDNEVTDFEIILNAEKRFNIKIKKPVYFIHLKLRNFLEARFYPYFTLLGQCIGSIIVGIEAAFRFLPSVYFETTGFTFTLPIFRILGISKIASYVHYPMISTDMLQKVRDQRETHNNQRFISRSKLLSYFKLVYYRVLAKLYGYVGRCSNLIIVNSTWTKEHILSIWKQTKTTFVVFPPCNVLEFESIPLSSKSRKNHILSIGQFRPEKDHELQIRSFRKLKDMLGNLKKDDVKLVLIGSCRNIDDEHRVQKLQDLCKILKVENDVLFKLNVPYSELIECMKSALIGIHTMWNEHFGIGVVECMSAGLVMVAHNSGGPKLDIINNDNPLNSPSGFLADDEDTYSKTMYEILQMNDAERLVITTNARNSMKRFSDDIFTQDFLKLFDSFLL